MLPVAVHVGACAGVEVGGGVGEGDEIGVADRGDDVSADAGDGVVIDAAPGADAQAATSRPMTRVLATGDGERCIEMISRLVLQQVDVRIGRLARQDPVNSPTS